MEVKQLTPEEQAEQIALAQELAERSSSEDIKALCTQIIREAEVGCMLIYPDLMPND